MSVFTPQPHDRAVRRALLDVTCELIKVFLKHDAPPALIEATRRALARVLARHTKAVSP